MKRYRLISCTALVVMMLISNSCDSILEETPHSGVVPSAFNSEQGLVGGIAGVYHSMRNSWGTEGFYVNLNTGTDEILMGGLITAGESRASTYNGLAAADFSGSFGLYTSINTLNGILEFGPTTPNVPPATLNAYIGQAQFLRAFLYFYLVQTFGNIPLHSEYITKPSQADAPADPLDIYALIVSDLQGAITNLPNTPTAPFLGKAATAGTAKWLLAKVYLTRGWLTNSTADFTLAYTTANDLITTKSTYGFDLWQNYEDAFKPANDYGKETLFVSDHSSDPKYGYWVAGAAGGPVNLTPWMLLMNTPGNVGVNHVKDANGKFGPPILCEVGASSPVRTDTNKPDYYVVPQSDPVQANRGKIVSDGDGNPIAGYLTPVIQLISRDVQHGRPFSRIRPNSTPITSGANVGKSYLMDQAFADRVNDSRYSKTFQTVWLANSPPGGSIQTITGNYTGPSVTGTRGQLMGGLDTAIWCPDYEVVGAPQKFGTRPFKGVIITPSMQTANVFPYMKKYQDPGRASFNDPSNRPLVLARFSDVYLIAAEAAFKGGGTLQQAADMLNVVRKRAAYRSGAPYVAAGAFGLSSTSKATMIGDPWPAGLTLPVAEAAMTLLSTDVTLDLILDERTREFFGEGFRWLDLVRTKSLQSRVAAWNREASPYIQSFHSLRPIPLDQINLVTVGPPYPQNPGY